MVGEFVEDALEGVFVGSGFDAGLVLGDAGAEFGPFVFGEGDVGWLPEFGGSGELVGDRRWVAHVLEGVVGGFHAGSPVGWEVAEGFLLGVFDVGGDVAGHEPFAGGVGVVVEDGFAGFGEGPAGALCCCGEDGDGGFVDVPVVVDADELE